MKIPRKFLFLIAIASGTCWGTYGTFATLLRENGFRDGTISMVVPVCYSIFFLILLLKDDIRKIKVSKKSYGILVFFGLETAVFYYSLIKAYQYLPIAIVSTIVFCNLFLLIIFSRLLFHQKITWQKGVSAGMAVIGIAMVLNVFAFDCVWSIWGLMWTGISLITWATVITTEKYLLEKGIDGNAVMVYNGVFALLFLSFSEPPWRVFANIASAVTASRGAVLLPLLGFVFFTAILSYFFYITALKRLEPAYVQLGYVMDPLTASLLGFFVFDQRLQPVQIMGILLILLVVVWVEWLEVKSSRAAESAEET